MTPQIQTLLTEASALSQKLQGKINELNAAKAALESLNRNEKSDQQELDSLLASGDFNNADHVNTVAAKNAKLQLYPAKRKQVEADIVAKDQALETYVSGTQNLLVRFGSECRAAVERYVASFLKTFISEQHRVDALAQSAGSYADLSTSTNFVYGVFSPAQIAECRRDGQGFEGIAKAAAATLDGLPSIVDKYALGKVIASAS